MKTKPIMILGIPEYTINFCKRYRLNMLLDDLVSEASRDYFEEITEIHSEYLSFLDYIQEELPEYKGDNLEQAEEVLKGEERLMGYSEFINMLKLLYQYFIVTEYIKPSWLFIFNLFKVHAFKKELSSQRDNFKKSVITCAMNTLMMRVEMLAITFYGLGVIPEYLMQTTENEE